MTKSQSTKVVPKRHNESIWYTWRRNRCSRMMKSLGSETDGLGSKPSFAVLRCDLGQVVLSFCLDLLTFKMTWFIALLSELWSLSEFLFVNPLEESWKSNCFRSVSRWGVQSCTPRALQTHGNLVSYLEPSVLPKQQHLWNKNNKIGSGSFRKRY